MLVLTTMRFQKLQDCDMQLLQIKHAMCKTRQMRVTGPVPQEHVVATLLSTSTVSFGDKKCPAGNNDSQARTLDYSKQNT